MLFTERCITTDIINKYNELVKPWDKYLPQNVNVHEMINPYNVVCKGFPVIYTNYNQQSQTESKATYSFESKNTNL